MRPDVRTDTPPCPRWARHSPRAAPSGAAETLVLPLGQFARLRDNPLSPVIMDPTDAEMKADLPQATMQPRGERLRREQGHPRHAAPRSRANHPGSELDDALQGIQKATVTHRDRVEDSPDASSG